MKKIVIVGSYCTANKGDNAMVSAAMAELQSQFDVLDLTLASPFPEIDGPMYVSSGIRVIPSQRRKLGRCVARMLAGRASFLSWDGRSGSERDSRR